MLGEGRAPVVAAVHAAAAGVGRRRRACRVHLGTRHPRKGRRRHEGDGDKELPHNHLLVDDTLKHTRIIAYCQTTEEGLKPHFFVHERCAAFTLVAVK